MYFFGFFSLALGQDTDSIVPGEVRQLVVIVSYFPSTVHHPIALVASRTGRKPRRATKWSPGRDAAVPGGRTAVRNAHARPLLIDVAKSRLVLTLGLNELSSKYRTMISLR